MTGTKRQRFLALVEQVERKYGSQQKAAEALGIGNATLSQAKDRGTFGLETCLRIADALGVRFSTILRIADKADLGEIAERLDGRRDDSFTRDEREMIKLWRNSEIEIQQIVKTIMERDAEAMSVKAARSGSVDRRREPAAATVAD